MCHQSVVIESCDQKQNGAGNMKSDGLDEPEVKLYYIDHMRSHSMTATLVMLSIQYIAALWLIATSMYTEVGLGGYNEHHCIYRINY